MSDRAVITRGGNPYCVLVGDAVTVNAALYCERLQQNEDRISNIFGDNAKYDWFVVPEVNPI